MDKKIINQITSSFELRLIIIAILIPIFFEYLPNFIAGVFFPPLSFDLALYVSYILAFLWLFTLLIGLLKICYPSLNIFNKIFEPFFVGVASLTSFLLTLILAFYLGFFIALKVGQNIFILVAILSIITNIILIVLSFLKRKK